MAGPLRTVGNGVVDANGSPLLLRGIQRIGLQSPGTWPAITDAEIGHAQAWGANIIRLPLSEAFSNPQCPTQYRPDYFDAVDAAVNSVTSRGMVALLELSYVTRVPCGQPDRWDMADRPVSIPFWRTVATRYGANPLVAFDLFNEPHGISDDQWRNGGEVVDWSPAGSTRWTAAGMQELYNAVRSTGAANLITISGNDWSASPHPILTGNAVTGSNFVYGLHAYTCPEPEDRQWCTSNPGNDHARIDPAWTRVGAHSPVMITEFGWPDPSDGAYNASVINAARAQNWGWIAFAWTGKANDVFGLVADLNTYSPTASGAPVVAALRSPR